MRLARTLLPAPLLAIVFLLLLSSPAHAQNPDYSGTPDILHGQNYLLQNDDIVVVQANQPLPASSQAETNTYLYEMLTGNGAITSVQAITSTVPMTPAPISTRRARRSGACLTCPTTSWPCWRWTGRARQVPSRSTSRSVTPKTGNTIKQTDRKP